jgi:hypothetical protein
VVPVVLVVVLVEVVVLAIGAQRNFAAAGVTVRAPNWSLTATAGGAPFGHATL